MGSPPRTRAHSHTRRGIARGHLDYPSPTEYANTSSAACVDGSRCSPKCDAAAEQSREVRLPRRRKKESGIPPSTPTPHCHPSVVHTSLLGVLRPGSFNSGCADVSPVRLDVQASFPTRSGVAKPPSCGCQPGPRGFTDSENRGNIH